MNFKTFIIILGIIPMVGCSSTKKWFGIHSGAEPSGPISNPFANYRPNSKESAQPLILRTKKGDRAVELEMPSDTSMLSDFVLPVSPAFKDQKNGSSQPPTETEGSPLSLDESYKDRPPTITDQEIMRSLATADIKNETLRTEIEQSLNLTASEDNAPNEDVSSYLAGMDKVKQLYKLGRYEAALIEADGMIRIHQTDPKLYEMRGTLLDRLGRRGLAIKAWNQALRFNPKNEGLRRFIERKQALEGGGAP